MGRLVGGQDDLLVLHVQGVEGVEELLQGLLLAAQELDVVEQEDVDLAVAVLEAVHVAVGHGGDEVGDELLAGDVLDADAGVELARVVADGVQQVGLAQARSAVDEQGVVGALVVVDGQVEGVEVRPGRGLGDGEGRGPGQAVGGALDVGVEGVARVEARGVGVEGRPGLRCRRRLRGGQVAGGAFRSFLEIPTSILAGIASRWLVLFIE